MPLLSPRAPAQCWVPADVHASLDQVQIVSFCQKALGWLLVSPTVLTPRIFIMLSSTYSEGKKSSQSLSLSSPPAHPRGAVPPCGCQLLSSAPLESNRWESSSQAAGGGCSEARTQLRMGCLQPAKSFQNQKGQEREAVS